MNTKSNSFAVLLIILITLIFYLPGVLSPRDFWVEDEARYGEILREMLDAGQWFVPHLNNHFYPDKPPVYFWLAATVSLITGKITPFSGLIITWITTLGAILTTYFFTKKLYNQRAAFLASLVLTSTFLVLGCAQIVRMDMMMTWFVTWAIYAFYLGYTKGQTRWYYLFYIFAALAVMGKGPLGFTFAWFPAIIYLMTEKKWKELFKFVVHPGFILFLLLAVSWILAAWFTGNKDFVNTIINEQLLGRAVKSFSHKEPIYFYLMLLPFVLLPWSPFIPRALKRGGKAYKLLILWFVLGFVTISILSGKLFIYLLPLVPAVAMMLGKLFDELLTYKGTVKAWRIESMIAILLTFGFFIALVFAAPHYPIADQLRISSLAWVFIPLTLVAVWFAWKQKIKHTFVLLFLGMYIFSFYLFQVMIPQLNSYFSAREIGAEIAQHEQEGYTVSIFRVRRGILNFYAETYLPEKELSDLDGFFETPNQLLIMKKSEYKKQQKLLADTHVLSNYEIANEKYVIIGKNDVKEF